MSAAGGHRDLVTVVGSLLSASAGEWLAAAGVWDRDRQHGLQLKATVLKTVPPTTVEGIQKHLGCGMVKGIGPVFAKRMLERFGPDILSVIEHRSGELETVAGIGPQRRQEPRRAPAVVDVHVRRARPRAAAQATRGATAHPPTIACVSPTRVPAREIAGRNSSLRRRYFFEASRQIALMVSSWPNPCGQAGLFVLAK